MSKGRRALVYIKYNGKDISKDIEPHLLSFSYTDNEEEADDFQITLEDSKKLWQGDWYPKKGDKVKAEIHLLDYNKPGQNEIISCGTCEIDSVGFNGPPRKVILKAKSIPGTNTINNSKPSHAWEKITLSGIAGTIAQRNGLSTNIDISNDKFYDRVDQNEESDLSFLKRLCKDLGLSLKVYDMKIIILDDSKYYYKKPVDIISIDDYDLQSYSFDDNLLNAYGSALVSYKNPDTGKTHRVSVNNPINHGTSKVLKINKRVKSDGEARNLGAKSLQDKNKNTRVASFTLSGRALHCKQNIEVKGWMKSDGKYMINKANHSVTSSGYKVSIDCSKI